MRNYCSKYCWAVDFDDWYVDWPQGRITNSRLPLPVVLPLSRLFQYFFLTWGYDPGVLSMSKWHVIIKSSTLWTTLYIILYGLKYMWIGIHVEIYFSILTHNNKRKYICTSHWTYVLIYNLALFPCSELRKPFDEAFICKLQILCNISLDTHTHIWLALQILQKRKLSA